MKTQELRLGNWILPDKTEIPMRVVNLGADYLYLDFEGNKGDVWEPDMKKICGIPLTEELLLKCGFEKSRCPYENDVQLKLDQTFHTTITSGISNTIGRDWSVHIDNYDFQTVGSGDVQYLHQLQNLYFALTGEELEINL